MVWGDNNNDSSANWLLEKTAYTAVDSYEYQHGKMLITLFAQADNGSLYRLLGIYRNGNPTLIPNPVWEVSEVSLCGDDTPNEQTSLASIVSYDGPGPGCPTIRLFYLDSSNYIREITWVNGEESAKVRLPFKAMEGSSLSAVHWKENNVRKIRLYYQSQSGPIEEIYKDGGGNWTKGSTLDFSQSGSHGFPLNRTSLSFINSSMDAPHIRGYWQADNNAIREFQYDGKKWSLSDWVCSPAAFTTPIAAVSVGDRNDPTILIYHISDEKTVHLTKRNRDVTEVVDSQKVFDSSKLAVVNTDNGLHVFATAGNKMIKRVAPKNGQGDFKSPTPLKLPSDSPLKMGWKPPPIIQRDQV